MQISEATNITSNSATCAGVVVNGGGDYLELKGIYWNISENPTTNNPKFLVTGIMVEKWVYCRKLGKN